MHKTGKMSRLGFRVNESFQYIYQSAAVISSKWHVIRCLGSDSIWQLRMCFFKNTEPEVENDYSSYFDLNTVRSGGYWRKVCRIFSWALAEQTKSTISWCPPIKIFLGLFLATVTQAKLKTKQCKEHREKTTSLMLI